MKVDIEILERLDREATLGPWRYDDGSWTVEYGDNRNEICDLSNTEPTNFNSTDGYFIAEIRNMLPDIIAELKELRKRDWKLSALESGGVDNWEWYDDSISDFREKVPEPEGE